MYNFSYLIGKLNEVTCVFKQVHVRHNNSILNVRQPLHWHACTLTPKCAGTQWVPRQRPWKAARDRWQEERLERITRAHLWWLHYSHEQLPWGHQRGSKWGQKGIRRRVLLVVEVQAARLPQAPNLCSTPQVCQEQKTPTAYR